MAPGPSAERLLGLLGLARRAGKLAVGATAVTALIAAGRRPLVVLASDAGTGWREKLPRLGPLAGLLDGMVDRDALSRALGRRQVVVVAVSDPAFVHGLRQLSAETGGAGAADGAGDTGAAGRAEGIGAGPAKARTDVRMARSRRGRDRR